MKIIIIGQGNVGTNLQAAFGKKQVNVEMVSSRDGLDTLPDADVYIYAVRYNALAEVVEKVRAPRHVLHLHTSGSMPLSVFGEDKPHAGIFYPFQSFTKTHIIEDFSRVPVFFEARNIDDVTAIYSLAVQLTPHVYEASQHDRERLHVAGVFANNFTNQMYAVAADLLRTTHIPFSALFPLIDETAEKIHSLSPREAQTGPAIRGDEAVIQKHMALLSEEDRAIYELISRRIQK